MVGNLTLRVMLALPKGVSVTECKVSVTVHVGVNPALINLVLGHQCLLKESVGLTKNMRDSH